jgi:hypothetical protein
MKRMLILVVTLWFGVSATAHAQVSLSVGTQPNPQVSAQTSAQVNSPANTVFSAAAPVAVPCPSAGGDRSGEALLAFDITVTQLCARD